MPMITPSAIRPTSAACSGVPIPKPTATGTGGIVLDRRDQLGERSAAAASRSPVVRVSETT